MSRCISSRGEYSEHTFPPPKSARGEDRFVCALCGDFDEWAAVEALLAAEAIAEKAREYRDIVGRLADDASPAAYDAADDAQDHLFAAVDAERERGQA